MLPTWETHSGATPPRLDRTALEFEGEGKQRQTWLQRDEQTEAIPTHGMGGSHNLTTPEDGAGVKGGSARE